MKYKKKYNEALERMKSWARGEHPECFSEAQKTAEFIFPELQESEDERIRKEIIDFLELPHPQFVGKRDREKWIAWLEKQGEFDDNIITRDDEILQAIAIGLTDVVEDAGWSDFGGLPIEEIQDWLEKQGSPNTFEVSETSIKDAEEVTSRMQHIEDDMRPIAEFIINYANWNLHKDEWNQPTLTVPLFRVLDALIQRGKPYGECSQSIEKQGENKPTDKVEPLFHVGEWITNGDYTWKIVGIKPLDYIIQSQDGNIVDDTISYVDEHFHLWSIQDAKDGNVLAYVTDEEDLWIMIYRSLYEPYEGHVHYHALLVNDNFSDKGTCCICIDNLKPATKEQRELLFQKMKEEGYEWDSEKKELKKIEPKFKPGDYIVFNGLILHIDEVVNGYYRTTSIGDGIHNSYDWDIDNAARLWTIADAKDGDVLVDVYGNIGIFDKCYDFDWMSCCSLGNNEGFQYFTVEHENEKTYPATKEQRKLLFQKMKEAGYEWDSEKKELKKMEVVSKESEDERIKKTIIRILKGEIGYTTKEDIDKYVTWLEKQGEKSTIIDIDKMVMEYSQTKDGDFGLPVNCMLRAYRKGINDALFITLLKKDFGS